MSDHWVVVGVDPGFHGGVGLVYCDHGKFGSATFPTPITVVRTKRKFKKTKAGNPVVDTDVSYNLLDMFDLLVENTHPFGKQVYVAIEVAHARPLDSKGSVYRTGYGCGLWDMAIRILEPARHVVLRPDEWRPFMVGTWQDKAHSLAVARQLFPQTPLPLAKDEGRAEALLIAQYAAMFDFALLPQRRPKLAHDLTKEEAAELEAKRKALHKAAKKAAALDKQLKAKRRLTKNRVLKRLRS